VSVLSARAVFLLDLFLGAAFLYQARGGDAGISQDRSSSEIYFQIGPAPNGWPESAVTSIVQTRQGYLWLGTYHGLLRFDGVRFAAFSSGNTPGLANGLITALREDSQGTLWIGHETGHATCFRNGRFEPVVLSNSWPGGGVEAIVTDQDDDVWVLNDTGWLYRVRDAKVAQVPGGASPTRKVAVVRGPDGKVWLVANGAINTLEHGAISPFRIEGATDFFERVLPAPDGGLWGLGNQRLRNWLAGRLVA